MNLLDFRLSDRKKSIEIEKSEGQQRLLTNLGRTVKTPLDQLEENLYLLRREKQRDSFEHQHRGDFTRLFPIKDEQLMNESLIILTKCFEILSKTPSDLSWNSKYSFQFNEQDLLDQISQFNFLMTKDVKSDKPKKTPSNAFQKQVSTQTPSDILRSSSVNTPKRPKSALVSTGRVSRPTSDSRKPLPGVSASRITEKKAYLSHSSDHLPEEERPISERRKKSNEKSQMVTQSAILQATRQSLDQTTTIDMTKVILSKNQIFVHLKSFSNYN